MQLSPRQDRDPPRTRKVLQLSVPSVRPHRDVTGLNSRSGIGFATLSRFAMCGRVGRPAIASGGTRDPIAVLPGIVINGSGAGYERSICDDRRSAGLAGG